MKKVLLALAVLMGTVTAQADDYSYLTFELTDGAKASVEITSLTLTISGNTLTAGDQTFTLENLSKMYFSTTDETAQGTATGISETMKADLDEATEIYDLQGHRVSRDQMRRGVYIIKSSKGTYKVNIR